MREEIQQQERLFWMEQIMQAISIKSSGYSPREKQNTKIPFILKVIQKVSHEPLELEDWKEFQAKVEAVSQTLPQKTMEGKFDYGKSLQLNAQFKTYVMKKFKYVPKGAYLRIWLFLGIVVGFVGGLIFSYLLPGLILGVGVGLLVGSLQDKKALAKHRVL